MSRISRALAVSCAVLAGTAGAAELRTGGAAFGDWSRDAPGILRKITPADLPAPGKGVANSARMVDPPAGAMPKVPAGFTVETFAEGLKKPRVIRVAPNGDVFVAETGAGAVRVFKAGGGRGAVFADGVKDVYGIAFWPVTGEPQFVYVAGTDSVMRYPYRSGDTTARGAAETVVSGLPTRGHWTRDIAFSADGQRLFIAVGSRGNVAEDMPKKSADEIRALEAEAGTGAAWGDEARRATVLVTRPDGSGGLKQFANGIRNCSGLGVQPGDGALWCVTNERDMLGDDLPPEYATRVQEGGFYGWPWYYIGPNQDPRHAGARPDLASKVIVPDVLMQPHSAPLQIAFAEGRGLPAGWQGSAFVTLHGSWNRASPTGFKVVRLPMKDGKPTGEYEDFLTGLATKDGVWGRPVGVAVLKDGTLLVGEDGRGTIWRIRYKS